MASASTPGWLIGMSVTSRGDQAELWADFAKTRGLTTAPYQRHSETSYEAARSVSKSLGTRQAEVLAYIRSHGPVTDAQVIAGLGRGANGIRPRRVELVRLGQVCQQGSVKQANGRRAALWVAT